ncbi:hypothetical protein GCM10010524_54410 [Streptomyces mexicanus]
MEGVEGGLDALQVLQDVGVMTTDTEMREAVSGHVGFLRRFLRVPVRDDATNLATGVLAGRLPRR